MIGGLLGGSSAVCSLLYASTLGTASSMLFAVVAAVALVTGIASAIYGARMKTALQASQDAAAAWKEERDAEKAKAERLEEHLRHETSALRAAEARTDVTRLENLVVDQHREALAICGAIKDTLQILAANRG